jgi:Na+-transporting methylmalonyl-CoA/oxaloacetate decarboxylase gamma subunit
MQRPYVTEGRDLMNASLSLLGAIMLILIGLAIVLAVVILILYETRWILLLGKQLWRSTSATGQISEKSEALQDNHGGA